MSTDILTLFGFKSLLFLALLLPVAALNRWVVRGSNHHYLFSYITGSILAAILLAFTQALSFPAFSENAFLAAAGIVAMIFLWKFLFGPWSAPIKAAVLGTFIFWIAVDILLKQSSSERIATILALLVALIPAVIWCVLFLGAHKKRISVVILTFFAGMLSTVPILFYDHVVRSGYELHFFLFRITPESFMRSSRTFVTQSLTGELGIVSSSIAVTIVSFIIVAIIEEWSKNWVIRKSDRKYFQSVGDVMQLSIIAAIGFAFAENIINPNYFIAFVKNYLVLPSSPQWSVFFGSVFGRSVITNMVHITSSGVLGYYYGLAFFARPVLEDDRARGRKHPFIAMLHRLLQVRRVTLFRDEKMLEGLFYAIGLHSLFNILVSLPDILPGHPETLGQLFGFTGPFSAMGIVMIPALLYVFGGWFLLMYLFRKNKDHKEFGFKLRQEVFVKESATA